MTFRLQSSILLFSAVTGSAYAIPADTLRNYDIEEVVVVTSPKETSSFRRQPVSASVLDAKALTLAGSSDIKGVSAVAPNFFMPDYGSRYTAAAYIRGIGSRINSPAVALYVDNVPFMHGAAYDFSFLDVSRVDVLRGSQGTLYGPGSMAGLVRVYTTDPFKGKGTDAELSFSGRNAGRSVKAVTYLHPSDRLALSVGGFYEGDNGFFRNSLTGRKADASEAGGGKLRLAARPSDQWRLDFSLAYEYSDEDACPYYLVSGDNQAQGYYQITQNRQSNYRRELLTSGFTAEFNHRGYTVASVTSWQHLRDRFFMDQDFSAADVFSLTQKQRLNTLTQEFTFKTPLHRRWNSTSGLFFMYQDLHTGCPVSFYADGVRMLNARFASVLPQRPPMSLAFTVDELTFDASLNTPSLGTAFFHQSKFDLGAGLSATAGIRFDYSHQSLDLNASSAGDMNYRFAMPSFGVDANLTADPSMVGELKNDNWQVLPKLALQYNHRSGRGNVYLAVSKGFRSGGYNVQSYSDLAQTQLRRNMMLGVKDYSIATINAMPLPEAAKQGAIAGLTATLDPQIPAEPDVAYLRYKPEQSWNYELGGHLKFFSGALLVDYTFFYMKTKDLQVSRFAESGLGREMVNAAGGRSCGAELAVRTHLFDDRLRLNAAYGYAHSVFTDYYVGERDGQIIDYTDNRVPYAPSHTLGASVAFRQPLAHSLFKAVGFDANVQGAGNFYWDEANEYSQPFYATLGAQLNLELAGGVSVSFWGRNLTASHYEAFSFESMGHRFAQIGQPRRFGCDVRLHF